MATKSTTKSTTKPKPEPKPRKVKEPVACSCNAVEINTDKDGNPVFGSCGGFTARRFVPGHDAKLKSALIRCYVAQIDYVVQGNDGRTTSQDPLVVANGLGWTEFLVKAKATADQVAQVAAARSAAKAAKAEEAAAVKAAKAEAKAAAKAAKAETKGGFHPVSFKIGRATYDGHVTSEKGDSLTVAYKDRQGNSKTATIKRSALVESA